MSNSKSNIKSGNIWSLITVEQLAADIASLGDRINQLNNETWRLNAETKLPSSLWAQVIEKLNIEHTEKIRHSLYKIWHLKRQNIDKLVKKELRMKNRNISGGHDGDIDEIEEASVVQENNLELLPDPSMPLPEQPNTRFNQAKTLDDNNDKDSITSETSFILGPSEWKAAFSFTRKTLNEGWTDIFFDKLTSCGITCSFSFYRAHVKEGKRKIVCEYFWCRGTCTGQYCSRSCLIKLKDKVNMNTSPIFRVKIFGKENHPKDQMMARQLCGEERYRVGKKLWYLLYLKIILLWNIYFR